MNEHVRTSAKALIIEDGKLLVLECKHPNVFYTLPGGGQRAGETLPETIQRECLEEIGHAVSLGGLLFVRDYIADHHEFAHKHPGLHQLELIFQCTLGERVPDARREADLGQEGIAWLPLDRIAEYELYPRQLRPYLSDMPTAPVYLGDIN